MILNLYAVTLRHDRGTVTITMAATNEESARDLVCKIECAPLRSVLRTKLVKTIYDSSQDELAVRLEKHYANREGQ